MSRLRSPRQILALLLASMSAATAPLIGMSESPGTAKNDRFPGWPALYEGRALTELPLSQREAAFTTDFPGRVGRFSDGKREIIIRWLDAPTRRLHPAADCLRGSGYRITPLPVRRDESGAAMGCFRATRAADDLMICELIRDGRGGSWPDVSAWYWSAMLSSSPGPWWSFVVAQRR